MEIRKAGPWTPEATVEYPEVGIINSKFTCQSMVAPIKGLHREADLFYIKYKYKKCNIV